MDASQHDLAHEPCRILVSAQTRYLLGGRFGTRDTGLWSLKGKEVQVHVFQVLGRVDSESPHSGEDS